MAYDSLAFLRHQIERGMSFPALCRAYGVQPREMRRTLAAAGLLRSIEPSDPQGHGQPQEPASGIVEPATGVTAGLTPLQRQLYRLLQHIAAEGQLCPATLALARSLKTEPRNVQQSFAALVRHGAIRVQVQGQRRVVLIRETGQSTAAPGGHRKAAA